MCIVENFNKLQKIIKLLFFQVFLIHVSSWNIFNTYNIALPSKYI